MFSEHLGKVTAIAKGAKKSKKRFVNKLELFSKISIQYKTSRTSTLLFLVGAHLEDAHILLRYNPENYIIATYLTELISKFTRERDQDTEIFELLEWGYSQLNNREKQLTAAAIVHLKLLTLVGYQPQIDCCTSCGQPLSTRLTYILQPGTGTLICSHCRGKSNDYDRAISLQTLKFMNKAMALELHKVNRLSIPGHVVQEILQVLYVYSRYLFQQDFHSWKMVKQGYAN
jgi:DNA repair protein RecO (recombination protein O)